jgi:hypothetical protein
MAQKRPSLAALASAAGSVRAVPPPAPKAEEADAPRSAEVRSIVPKSRVGTVPIAAFMPEEVRTQLKLLSVERRRSMESMIGEALNDLFAKYGKPEIAPVGEKRR